MALDASIYSQIQQPQMPSPLDAAQKAMTLSTLGMQQQQMQYQMAQVQAARQAYAANTDASGNVDKQGVVSTLSRLGFGPQAMQLGQQFAAQDKAQADAQAAQADAHHKILSVTVPVLGHLLSMPDDQAAQAYPTIMKQLKDQGIPMQNTPPSWDRGWAQQGYSIGSQMKEQLDNQLTQANIDKTRAETARDWAEAGAPAPQKLGAEELGKFNEDVNNASSRKTTGSLIDARTRADRILSILNSGAQPGESQQQRIARLNQYMPQIGTEIGTSLAAIMQGGVPNEDLQKKLSPDTISSNLATLEQKWKASPTAANQGALLDAYGDVAGKLREFSAGQLQQIASRARAAYPYANKYYSKEMDQIGSQIAAPSAGGGAAFAQAGQGKGSGGVLSSANAGEKAQPTAKDQAALQWLKSADSSSPKAFRVKAILKAKGLL